MIIRNPRRLIHWIATHTNLVLIAALLVLAGTDAFVKIAGEVLEGETQAWDNWAVRVLREPGDPAQPIGPRWLPEVGRDLTALGGVAVLAGVTLAVAGYLAIAVQYRALILVLIATIGGAVLSFILKASFTRPRPDIVPHLSYVVTSSFPSGHSMLSSVVYLTLGALLAQFAHRRALAVYFLAVALCLTFLVGISRVYMGVHYPTDVLAGWMAGLTWAVLCWLVARFLQRRGHVDPPSDEPTASHL